MATTPDAEKTCPGFELDQLQSIRDVTDVIKYAVGNATGAEANIALRTETAALQESCLRQGLMKPVSTAGRFGTVFLSH